MNNSINYPLPKQTFKGLASKHANSCISIYLSMHKTGKEQNEHLAQANLKHCIKEVQKNLFEYHYSKEESKNYLKPVKQLLDNIELWRNPSDGLAIFLDPKGLVYYTIPIPFETKTYVADHFYLKPLLPLYSDDGLYYVLELSMDYVKLYQASKHAFNELFIEDFAPDKLEEAVGYDFKPKMLQFRTGQAPHSSASFHGYGEGKDDEKKEILPYFKAIDDGLKKMIGESNAPLVLASVDKLFPLYKQANSYSNLFESNISGNTELWNKTKLHKESWKLVQPYFEKTKEDKLKQYKDLYHTPKTTFGVADTISAAMNGKINTLFIEDNTDLYGTYNKKNEHVSIDKKKKVNNASLLNLSALHTIKQGGEVFLLDSEKMPLKGQPLCALLRY